MPIDKVTDEVTNEMTNDPQELIEMAQVRDSVAGLTAPKMQSAFDEGKKMHFIEIPVPSGGMPKFYGRTPEELLQALAKGYWHACCKIRHQSALLKDHFTSDASDFQVCETVPFTS